MLLYSMKHCLRLLILVWAVIALVPAPANAHGAIFTHKYVDGDNLILLTHNVHEAHAHETITYNVRLYNMDGQLLPFENVIATVHRGKELLHTKTVHTTYTGDANVVYTYPTKGNYTVSLTFLDHDKNIAQATFPIGVAAGVDTGILATAFNIPTITAFILGTGAGMLLYMQRHYLTKISLPRRRKLKRSRYSRQ